MQMAGSETRDLHQQKFRPLRMHFLWKAIRRQRLRNKHFAQVMAGPERRARLAWCGNNLDRDVLPNDNA